MSLVKIYSQLSFCSQVALSKLAPAILDYKPSLITKVTRDCSLEALKAFCESAGILDPAAYPLHIPVLVPLGTWLQKALAAREAAMTYFREAKGKPIELID